MSRDEGLDVLTAFLSLTVATLCLSASVHALLRDDRLGTLSFAALGLFTSLYGIYLALTRLRGKP